MYGYTERDFWSFAVAAIVMSATAGVVVWKAAWWVVSHLRIV